MTASGCVWSTCARRDERVQQRLDRRPRLVGREAAAARGSRPSPRRPSRSRSRSGRSSSRRSAAKPAAVIVARSVPEPLTQSDARLAARVVDGDALQPTCCRRPGSRARGRRRAGSSGRRAPRAPTEAGGRVGVPAVARGRDRRRGRRSSPALTRSSLVAPAPRRGAAKRSRASSHGRASPGS